MSSDQMHVISNNSCSNAPIGAAGLSRTTSSTCRQGCSSRVSRTSISQIQHEGKQDSKKEVCQSSNSSVDHAMKLWSRTQTPTGDTAHKAIEEQ
jgi:hypothetical protein